MRFCHPLEAPNRSRARKRASCLMKNRSRGLKFPTPDNTVQKARGRFLSPGKFPTGTVSFLRALVFLAAFFSEAAAVTANVCRKISQLELAGHQLALIRKATSP